MRNTPSRSPKSSTLWQRLAIFAVLGCLSSCSSETKSGEENLIPLCEVGKSPKKGPSLKGEQPAKIVCVVDGDTFDVELANYRDQIMRVRLWGVDCPESSKNGKCMKKGKKKCLEEVEIGKKVTKGFRSALGDGSITLQPPYKNNGIRKMAYADLKGNDLSVSLIKSCACKARYQHKRKKDYQRIARECQ